MASRSTKKTEPRPSPGARGFSFADVVAATSASRSNLIHWTNTGIIVPDVADTAGSGHARRFSILNVVEVQIGATLNRFRVPAKLIGDAINLFRHFHELSVALWRATPAGEEPGHAFSCEHTTAAASVFAASMLRRDRLATGKSKHSQAFYERAVRPQLANDPAQQENMLTQAFMWRMFCKTIERRDLQFVGLFVFPDEQFSTIETEPIVLNDAIKDTAIVVNLGHVLNRVDDGLQMFAALDETFR